jgi:hypothetical protein
MKKMMMAAFGLAGALSVRAQTSAEWFDQNATRKQYNEQQIAALGTFITVAEKGYSIVESGLSAIKGIKTGELNLHSSFYASLESINPAIGNMGEIAEIVALQLATAERVNAALARYRQNGSMGTDEVTAVSQVLQGVVNAGISDVGTLIKIITPGKLQMTDDQRMDYIRELDASARAQYALAAGVTDQADLVSLQRQAEMAQAGVVMGLYGLQ